MLTVQRLMELNSSAAQTVKGAIPPPPAPYVPNPDPAKEAADNGRALRAYQDKAAAAEAEAQDACNHIYNPTMATSGDTVTRFVLAPPGPGGQRQLAPGSTNSDVANKNPAASPTSNGTAKDAKTGDSKQGTQPSADDTGSSTGTDQTQLASTNSSTATTSSSPHGSSNGSTGTGLSSQTT